jgi:hypothetical protein
MPISSAKDLGLRKERVGYRSGEVATDEKRNMRTAGGIEAGSTVA